MLENVKNFKDKTVLELAAGTGLLSLVTSSDQIRAKQVICTGAHLHLKVKKLPGYVHSNRESTTTITLVRVLETKVLY